MNKTLSKNKYYKQAYNNPSQYNFNEVVEKIETSEDQKTVSMFLNISIGLKDAKKDKEENKYKFIF